MPQGLPPVSEVIFLNGFIYILKGWPVIKPGRGRKGWNRWCSQWASSPTVHTSLVTNKEMYWETFVCVCVFPSHSLSWSATQTLSLLSFDPPCLNTSGQTVCQKPFPWQPGIPLDCVGLSFSCHTHLFWGQNCTRAFLEKQWHAWLQATRSFDFGESTDYSNWNDRYMQHTPATAYLRQQFCTTNFFKWEFGVKRLMYLSTDASLCQCNRWKKFSQMLPLVPVLVCLPVGTVNHSRHKLVQGRAEKERERAWERERWRRSSSAQQNIRQFYIIFTADLIKLVTKFFENCISEPSRNNWSECKLKSVFQI